MVGRNRSLIIIIVTVYYSLAAPLKLRSYGAIKIRLLLLFASRGQYTTALIAYLPSIALSLRAEVPRRSTPGIKGMTNCPSFKRAVLLASGRRAFRQDRSSSGGTADKPLDIPPSSGVFRGGPLCEGPPLWPDSRDFCNYFGIIFSAV